MDINPAWISVPISLLALGISAASWWHNTTTYRDKRFGDIAALRSELLKRLVKCVGRQRDMEVALDAAQLDLQQLDEKPRKRIRHYTDDVGDLTQLQKDTRQLFEIIEPYTPETLNTRKYLRYLQSTDHTVAMTEISTDQLEQVTNRRIEMIRTATLLRLGGPT
jgi:hypothetical protein